MRTDGDAPWGDAFGIEPRDEWLRRANAEKTSLKLDSVSFIKDDVRNFTKNKYGRFDVVLCLGLLYHLDAPEGGRRRARKARPRATR